MSTGDGDGGYEGPERRAAESEIAHLRRELADSHEREKSAKLDATLSNINASVARTEALAVEAKAVAGQASLRANEAYAKEQTHEEVCAQRYVGIDSKLEPLQGLPGAVVELASQVAASKALREQQHAANAATLAAQDEALAAIRKSISDAKSAVATKVIGGLVAALLSAFGLIGWLMQTYVLSRLP